MAITIEPTSDETQRLQHWEHACSLAGTNRAAELLELHVEHLLYRLCHQDPVRLYEPAPVSFHCTCSCERTRYALVTLQPTELEELLEELGSITKDCEFCNQHYCFNRNDLAGVLEDDVIKTLHR